MDGLLHDGYRVVPLPKEVYDDLMRRPLPFGWMILRAPTPPASDQEEM